MVKATCRPMQLVGVEDCDDCPHGKRHTCNILSLTYDLTAERHICPLNSVMEKCVVDGGHLPHVIVPPKASKLKNKCNYWDKECDNPKFKNTHCHDCKIKKKGLCYGCINYELGYDSLPPSKLEAGWIIPRWVCVLFLCVLQGCKMVGNIIM